MIQEAGCFASRFFKHGDYVMRKVLLSILIILSFCTQTALAMPFFEKKENIVLITYHKISENESEQGEYCVSPELFESDLKYLKEKGYQFWTVSQLAVSDTTGQKVAVITFDDGYESDYRYAVPLLEKYNACGTFFVIGSKINTPGYLSDKQLREISQKNFVEIGNHSYEIHDYPFNVLEMMYSNEYYHEKIFKDYEKNDVFLQNITGIKPIVISYPNGIYGAKLDNRFKTGGKLVSVSTEEVQFRLVNDSEPLGRKNRSMRRNIEQILR